MNALKCYEPQLLSCFTVVQSQGTCWFLSFFAALQVHHCHLFLKFDLTLVVLFHTFSHELCCTLQPRACVTNKYAIYASSLVKVRFKTFWNRFSSLKLWKLVFIYKWCDSGIFFSFHTLCGSYIYYLWHSDFNKSLTLYYYTQSSLCIWMWKSRFQPDVTDEKKTVRRD